MVSGHESNRRFYRALTRVRQSCNLRNPRNHRLDRIMRLILIDNYSGYIFGEFHTANYTGNFDLRDGYLVYRADVRGSEQVPGASRDEGQG